MEIRLKNGKRVLRFKRPLVGGNSVTGRQIYQTNNPTNSKRPINVQAFKAAKLFHEVGDTIYPGRYSFDFIYEDFLSDYGRAQNNQVLWGSFYPSFSFSHLQAGGAQLDWRGSAHLNCTLDLINTICLLHELISELIFCVAKTFCDANPR